MCWVFIEQAAAGVSIRVTWRELDQELLHCQPGAFLGWATCSMLGISGGGGTEVGKRAEFRLGWGGAEAAL